MFRTLAVLILFAGFCAGQSVTLSAHFQPWYYGRIITTITPSMVENLGLDALRLYSDLLQVAAPAYTKDGAPTPEDGSCIWHSRIEIDEDLHSIKNVLVSATRNVAAQLAHHNPVTTRNVVAALEARPTSNPESGTASCTTLPLPLSGLEQYTYDTYGNPLTKTDARGVITTYSAYDGLNRPHLKTYSDGTPQVTHSYDQDIKGALSLVTHNDQCVHLQHRIHSRRIRAY